MFNCSNRFRCDLNQVVAKTSISQECDSDGIRCISCTDYQTCNAGVLEGVVISCKSGKGCADEQLRQCQKKLSCFAQTECTQNGIFPNQMDDTQFFVCLGDASSGFLKHEFTCPDGNFFDKTTQACVPKAATSADSETTESTPTNTESSPTTTESTPTNTESSPTTTESTPTNTESTPTNTESTPTNTESTPTITESTPTNTESSSTTTESSPTITESTPTNTESSPTNTESSPTTTESSPTNTESTPTNTESTPTITESTPTTTESSPTTTESTPTTTEPTPTITEPPAFVCTQPGTFPNPGNCKMYYRCSSTLKAFFYICPGNSYFNENILKCSLIITPACREQISKNLTSTFPPVTNTVTTTLKTTTKGSTIPSTSAPKPTTTSTSASKPTTTSTSAPKPTTTSTSASKPTTTSTSAPKPTTTTLATTAPSTPVPCLTEGSVPHPSDCKTYYRCSASGRAFLYTCPGKTYFNEFTKRCSLIMTARCKDLVQG